MQTFFAISSAIILGACLASTIPTNISEQPRTCKEIQLKANTSSLNSGVYQIFPKTAKHGIQVNCDFDTDGGGWTVIQKRHEPVDYDCSVDFYRNWEDYENGFGNHGENGSYWLGLKHIHELTKCEDAELRVDLMDWDDEVRHANYSLFRVGSALQLYELSVGGYTGNAGDAMNFHDGMKFSTFDRDNDKDSRHCAVEYQGGFWFNACHYANPNGRYILGGAETSGAYGNMWHRWQRRALKRIEMKIRSHSDEESS